MNYRVPEIKRGMVFISRTFSMRAEIINKDGSRAEVRLTATDGNAWVETWLIEDVEAGFRNGYYTDITEKALVNKSFDNYII